MEWANGWMGPGGMGGMGDVREILIDVSSRLVVGSTSWLLGLLRLRPGEGRLRESTYLAIGVELG